MKTTTNRSGNAQVLIDGCVYPNRPSPIQFRHVFADRGLHEIAALDALATKLLSSTETDRAQGTITHDTVLDLEIAVVAAIKRCTRLRFQEIRALRHCGPEADLIMPKRRGTTASIRLRPSKGGSKSPKRIQLDMDATSVLRVYLAHYRAEAV
jgi:hypothetical protein